MTDSYNFAPRRFNEFHHDYRFIEIYKYNAGEKRGISSIRAATFLITVSSAIFHPPESCHSRLFDRFQWRGGRRRDARGQRINAVRFLTRPLTVSEIQFRVSFFPFFFFFASLFFVRYIFFFFFFFVKLEVISRNFNLEIWKRN